MIAMLYAIILAEGASYKMAALSNKTNMIHLIGLFTHKSTHKPIESRVSTLA
jgi:hypothetical protein